MNLSLRHHLGELASRIGYKMVIIMNNLQYWLAEVS